jgi:ribonuclease HI
MEQSQTSHVRCPCCGETFALTDDLYVKPAAATKPAQPQQPVAPQPQQPAAPQPHNRQSTGVPIKLIFDGGSIGNPGDGYGSYQLTVEGKAEEPKRIKFGSNYTNNEAEYDTLIAALEAIALRANDPRQIHLDIRGDSQLVIKQITGAWKIKEPRMKQRAYRVHDLLKQFGSWRATWHDRSNSVDALGH